MRCNSCWRELEGRAVATTCGHAFCTEDANRILGTDSACPQCDQILSKSNVKLLDLNPNDEWTNMVMAGVSPQCIMKSAFKGVVFWIGQKDVESHITLNQAKQWKQRCQQLQDGATRKIEEIYAAYQKAMKKVQAFEAEKEVLMKDKCELEEKYAEKSRQKRKLEEMYESLRKEYEKSKRGAISLEPPPPAAAAKPAAIPGISGLLGGSSKQRFGGYKAPITSGFVGSTQRHTSPFKSTDSDMFAPPPSALKASNSLRNLLVSPLKRPASRLRSGG